MGKRKKLLTVTKNYGVVILKKFDLSDIVPLGASCSSRQKAKSGNPGCKKEKADSMQAMNKLRVVNGSNSVH